MIFVDKFFKYLIGQLYIKVETLKSIPEFF